MFLILKIFLISNVFEVKISGHVFFSHYLMEAAAGWIQFVNYWLIVRKLPIPMAMLLPADTYWGLLGWFAARIVGL